LISAVRLSLIRIPECDHRRAARCGLREISHHALGQGRPSPAAHGGVVAGSLGFRWPQPWPQTRKRAPNDDVSVRVLTWVRRPELNRRPLGYAPTRSDRCLWQSEPSVLVHQRIAPTSRRSHVDFCLRRGWDEITKAPFSRVFRGKVDQVKCRKTRLEAPTRHQTRHRAGFIQTRTP